MINGRNGKIEIFKIKEQKKIGCNRKKKKQLLKTEWGVKYGRELDEIDKTIEELSK
jgi:hypothetical protein